MKSIKTIFIIIITIILFITVAIFKPDYLFIIKTQLHTKNPIEMQEISFKDTELKPININDSTINYNQHLMLINQQNPINEDFTLNLTNYKESDMYIDSTIALDYTALVDAVKLNTDSNIYIMSSYRDANKQKEVYLEDPKIAALPNTSEHETGMALDIYTPQYAGSAFIKTKAGQYVNEHCDEFGFIIRYPINKKSITKIKYEPWHIRYVGLPHSTIMSHNNLCLEEYITSLNPNVFYKTDNYIISRQSQDTLTVPINTYDINISPDNTGYYIITAKIKELN